MKITKNNYQLANNVVRDILLSQHASKNYALLVQGFSILNLTNNRVATHCFLTRATFSRCKQPMDFQSIVVELEIDETAKNAICKGIKRAFESVKLRPHKFIVSELIEHWKDAPSMGFEMCAQGATKLALGLSNQNTTYPWSNGIKHV